MWSMEITISLSSVRDLEHLGNIAGELVDELESTAGETAPVVSGRFATDNPVIMVSLDIAASEPTEAVSDALALITRVAGNLGIRLDSVQSITLNAVDAPELASA
jgi:hypothetical protein